MVEYKCNKCNKVFKQKCHYDNHMNRKRPCIKLQQTSDEQQNVAINKEIIINNKQCPYCKIIFTRVSSLNVHLENRCKIKKEQNKEENNKLMKEIEELKLEINNIKRDLEKQNLFEDRIKYVYAINTGQTDDKNRIIYKCGRMSGSIPKILSRYGTYYPKLKLEYVHEVKNDCLIEHKLFEILKEYKHTAKREFLICDLDKIKSTFRDIILEYDY